MTGAPRRNPFPVPFLLGANYWPRHGLDMWRDWRPAAMAAELAALAGLGCRAVRVFLRWADFQPEPDRVDPVALERLAAFCDLAWRHGLGVIPTLFTGHMSGVNWDVPWRGGRCPYTDPGVLRAQVRLARAVAERLRGHPALLAWDLANEHDNFARPPSPDAGWLWARLLRLELGAVDPSVPVTVGIHVTSLVDDCGFRPADLADAHDFLCMHLYPIYSPLCPEPADGPRSTYLVPFGNRLVEGMAGKPVLAEEFGATTRMMSPERHGRYTAAVLAGLLLHGSLGALLWCACDLAVADRLPYDRVPFEDAFGILDARLRPKPAGEAVRRFARLLGRLPLGDWSPEPARAAILIPERYYEHADPEHGPARHLAVLFNAFVLARRAGFPVDLVPADGDWEGYRLLLLPGAPRRDGVSVRTWRRLRRWVRAGGTLYASYDGLAIEGMEELFGIRIEDAYPREADGVAPPFTLELLPRPGRPGEVVGRYPSLGRKRLRASPRGASVLARIGGEPAVFAHRYGRGRAFLATDPLEWLLAVQPGACRDDATHRLYARLADAAGAWPRWRCDHPDVECGAFRCGADTYLLLVSHRPEPLVATLHPPADLPPGAAWEDVETGEGGPVAGPLAVPLAPCGWRALRVTGDGPEPSGRTGAGGQGRGRRDVEDGGMPG